MKVTINILALVLFTFPTLSYSHTEVSVISEGGWSNESVACRTAEENAQDLLEEQCSKLNLNFIKITSMSECDCDHSNYAVDCSVYANGDCD